MEDYLKQVKIDGIYTYVGIARLGSLTSEAKWRIFRVHVEGNILKKMFADGNTWFDNVWDDVVTLTYS